MTHPSTSLDEVVHQRVRLGIMAILGEVPRADFRALRTALEVTDGNLSRHLGVLEDAGYISVAKVFEGRKPRTWITATRSGRAALAAEMGALRRLVEPGSGRD